MDDQGKVEELRREIAMIKELNDRYMLKKWPTDVDRVANDTAMCGLSQSSES